jgi:hypothetical protein
MSENYILRNNLVNKSLKNISFVKHQIENKVFDFLIRVNNL